MNTLPEWPRDIERIGGHEVYKGERYGVLNDGASAELPYYYDLAKAWESRCRLAVEAVKQVEAIFDKEDYEILDFLNITEKALADIGPLPPEGKP